MEEAKIYRQIWKTGQNTEVITIEKGIMRLLDLKRGDTIEATIKKVKTADEAEKETETAGEEEKETERTLFKRRE